LTELAEQPEVDVDDALVEVQEQVFSQNLSAAQTFAV